MVGDSGGSVVGASDQTGSNPNMGKSGLRVIPARELHRTAECRPGYKGVHVGDEEFDQIARVLGVGQIGGDKLT